MNPLLDPSLILAEALDAAAPEQALDRYPEQREALAPLLTAALELRALPEVAPSTEFQRTARARLLHKLPARPAERLNAAAPLTALHALWQSLFEARDSEHLRDAKDTRRPALRWILIGVLIATLVGAGVTTVAAESALPGQTLYPVKRWVEDARVAFALTSNEAAALRLSFAARRLNEAAALAQTGQAEAVAEVLAAYTVELAQARRDWSASPGGVDAEALRAALAEQSVQLEHLASQRTAQGLAALVEARNAWQEAAAALEAAGQPPAATSRTPTGTPTPTPTPTGSAAPTLISTGKPTLAITPPPTENRLINCVPPTWPTQVARPIGLPTCAPGTPPPLIRRATELPATLTALPTRLPATLTARPPIPTRLQPTLTALPTSLPATLTALPTRFVLPSDLPATLTALPDIAATLTTLPPLPNWQATPPAALPTPGLPPVRPPRP